MSRCRHVRLCIADGHRISAIGTWNLVGYMESWLLLARSLRKLG